MKAKVQQTYLFEGKIFPDFEASVTFLRVNLMKLVEKEGE